MKKLLSLLLSMTMIMGTIVMPTKAENGGIIPVTTETVEGLAEATDVYEIIDNGIETTAAFISSQLNEAHNNGGVTYGYEWFIIPMLRAGKTVNNDILDEYYLSVTDEVKEWTTDKKPTDVARVALALAVMGKDITNIEGVNIAELLYNNARLSEGSNEHAYTLLALDAVNMEIPDTAEWSRESIIEEILNFQLENGGFGLNDTETADVDMTAICLQALAPYQGEDVVKTATENGVIYLKNTISAEFNYSDNSNTTAQVLLALASLGIDITDADNGFGDRFLNIITALEGYKNTDGDGYVYNGIVNAMATVQVMQSYDGYKKAHKENVLYWAFTDCVTEPDVTEVPTPAATEEPTPVATATPVNVYVTIVSGGVIVEDKNGGHVAQAPVTVTDRNADGMLTVDEALYVAHEEYYNGGAEAGYSSYTGFYGLAIARLWGNGTEDSPASSGYYLNNESCWSLADIVSEGDYITAFNYYDANGWSDKYTFFTDNKVAVNSGSSITLTLKYSGYDADWNPITLPVEGANVVFLGNAESEVFLTSADGQVTIEFPVSNENKTYYVMAYAEDNSIVPTVCKIDVKKKSSGGSGSSINKITAYIKVYDPEGDTYLKKTAYSVESGTTALELLMETGLDVETTRSVYGEYVSSIEGLAEFDKGSASGWTYKVNGKMPDYSASSYVLKSGDIVEWLYTRGTDNDSVSGDTGKATPTPAPTVTPAPTEEPTPVPQKELGEDTFGDVSAEDWFYDSIKYVYENGFMDGTGDGFEPDITMSRAMLVTVLYRLDGETEVNSENKFDDVKDNEWYCKAVLWANGNGIVDGVTDSKFAPDGEVTREQMALIFYRYCKYKGYDVDITAELVEFNDADTISDWAVNAVKWANGIGLINGTSDTELSPKDSATRAQVATIFMRFCENIAVK